MLTTGAGATTSTKHHRTKRKLRRKFALTTAAVLVTAGLAGVPGMADAATAPTDPALVSLSPTGGATTGPSTIGMSSADGRWTVFLSQAPEYGAGGRDVAVLADVAGKTATAFPRAFDNSTAYYP